MSPTPAVARNSARFAAGLRALLRLSLILSTWNGPLPLVHAHSLQANVGAAHSALLSQHVAAFHESAAEAGERFLSWHVHWLLPNDWQAYPCHEPSGGDRPHPENSGTLGGGTAVLAKTAVAVGPDLGKPTWSPLPANSGLFDHVVERMIRENRFAPAHFLASYHRSASLNELFSVWRC